MPGTGADDASSDPVCDRCGDALGAGRWGAISVAYAGAAAAHYRTVERWVCLDCVVAMGLLEYAETTVPEGNGETDRSSPSARPHSRR